MGIDAQSAPPVLGVDIWLTMARLAGDLRMRWQERFGGAGEGWWWRSGAGHVLHEGRLNSRSSFSVRCRRRSLALWATAPDWLGHNKSGGVAASLRRFARGHGPAGHESGGDARGIRCPWSMLSLLRFPVSTGPWRELTTGPTGSPL